MIICIYWLYDIIVMDMEKCSNGPVKRLWIYEKSNDKKKDEKEKRYWFCVWINVKRYLTTNDDEKTNIRSNVINVK